MKATTEVSEENLILCVLLEYPLKDVTEKIIFEVHSALSPGLLESIYEQALAYEFEF